MVHGSKILLCSLIHLAMTVLNYLILATCMEYATSSVSKSFLFAWQNRNNCTVQEINTLSPYKKYCGGTVVSDDNTTVLGTVPWYCMITIFMYCRIYNTLSSKILQKYHGTMSKNMVHFCKRRQTYYLFPRTINTHFLSLSLSNRPPLQTHKQTHT